MPKKTSTRTSATAVALAATMAVAGWGTSVATAQASAFANKAGVTINVAIAYPAPPAKLLEQFTAQTGIKVNYSYIQWDNLQTKIAAAAEAHTYFADVADVDWSKVGEYYATKWFMALNKYFNVGGAVGPVPTAGLLCPRRRAPRHAERRLPARDDGQHQGLRQSRHNLYADDAGAVHGRPERAQG